ncbi:hypothetical protein [Rosistilla oblonga]|uniref:hypothetical protein n=1 Tax=Rosistilla oblonga TaxID=2527990 RepID=UPI003A97BE86
MSVNLNYRFIQMYPRGFGVQLGEDGGFTIRSEIPNAREHAEFIASAPHKIEAQSTLIAELVGALELMKGTYPYSLPCHNWEPQAEAHKAAKAALTKAKDQTNDR